MPDALLAALLVLPFYGATLAADALAPRVAWLPLALLCVLSFLGLYELARYDHGHPDLLFAVGYVGAPLGAILGGASWGTRRFYGWPDLGPHPSRLGLWCAFLLLGVLLGTRTREADIRLSQARAEGLARDVLAWRTAHAGRWPSDLAQVVGSTPLTALGWFAPPPFVLEQTADGAAWIRFAISANARLALAVEQGRWVRSVPKAP